jgi:hypothetical protein
VGAILGGHGVLESQLSTTSIEGIEKLEHDLRPHAIDFAVTDPLAIELVPRIRPQVAGVHPRERDQR